MNIGLIVLAIIGIIIISHLEQALDKTRRETQSLKQECIQRGYAIYNPTNGAWQWKTNSVN